MKLTLFTDPHLGAVRSAHSTVASRSRLADRLFEQAHGIVTAHPASCICLGDLYDTYSNDEKTIKQGMGIMALCRIVLAGNHDVVSRSDKLGSLELADHLGMHGIAINPYGEASVFSEVFGDTEFVLLPHVADQEMFVTTLKTLLESGRSAKHKVLLLHCNVANDMVAGSDGALNLDLDLARQLLSNFDYIFVGHEHDPKTYLDGRVVVLGNTLPLTFGEISDRFIYHFDTITGTFTKEKIWDKATRYVSLTADEVIAEEGVCSYHADFIDVTGTVGVDKLAPLARAFVTLWKVNPYILMIRNAVEVQQGEVKQAKIVGKVDLADIIRKALEGTDLAPLFDQLVKEN